MKRDLDLCRRILLEVEAREEDPRTGFEIDLGDDHPHSVVSEHVRLLSEAGLIDADEHYTFGPDGYTWLPKRVTWYGHEFLNAASDDTNWNEAKRRLADVGSGSVSLVVDLLLHIAKEKLGIST